MNGIKVRLPWAPADVALITDWCRKYPRGCSFDWRRVKAEHPQEWQRLLNQGRREVNIVQKGDYISRVHLKRVPALSRLRKGPPYTCRICNQHGFKTKQHLGIHVRMQHPGQRSPGSNAHRPLSDRAIIEPRLPEPAVVLSSLQKTVDYCPCCGTNLRAVRDAIK